MGRFIKRRFHALTPAQRAVLLAMVAIGDPAIRMAASVHNALQKSISPTPSDVAIVNRPEGAGST